jgi:hypothetical protein
MPPASPQIFLDLIVPFVIEAINILAITKATGITEHITKVSFHVERKAKINPERH